MFNEHFHFYMTNENDCRLPQMLTARCWMITAGYTQPSMSGLSTRQRHAGGAILVYWTSQNYNVNITRAIWAAQQTRAYRQKKKSPLKIKQECFLRSLGSYKSMLESMFWLKMHFSFLIFALKIPWPRGEVKKNCHKLQVYCTQNDRKDHTN